MKKSLQRLLKSEKDGDIPSTSTDSRKSIREPKASSSCVLDEVCIFCNKQTKIRVIKGIQSREDLSQSREFRSDERIREVAQA